MLEGATAEPPPPPPPIVVTPPARSHSTSPPPPAQPAPEVVAQQRMPGSGVFSRAGRTGEMERREVHRIEQLGELRESASAHAHASLLHETVARRLEAVDRAIAHARSTAVVDHRRRRPVEAEAVLELLRQPHSARQLVIAQAVIGSPKALES
jgi:hypothetical protein